jgi:hypothetical protein
MSSTTLRPERQGIAPPAKQPFVALWDADTSALKTELFPSYRDNQMSALAFSRDGSICANGVEVLADTLPDQQHPRLPHR